VTEPARQSNTRTHVVGDIMSKARTCCIQCAICFICNCQIKLGFVPVPALEDRRCHGHLLQNAFSHHKAGGCLCVPARSTAGTHAHLLSRHFEHSILSPVAPAGIGAASTATGAGGTGGCCGGKAGGTGGGWGSPIGATGTSGCGGGTCGGKAGGKAGGWGSPVGATGTSG